MMVGYEREDGQVPNCELPLEGEDTAQYCDISSVLSESATSTPPTPSAEDTSSPLNPRPERELFWQFLSGDLKRLNS